MLLKIRTKFGPRPGEYPEKTELFLFKFKTATSHAYIYALSAGILDRSGNFLAKNRPDMEVRTGNFAGSW